MADVFAEALKRDLIRYTHTLNIQSHLRRSRNVFFSPPSTWTNTSGDDDGFLLKPHLNTVVCFLFFSRIKCKSSVMKQRILGVNLNLIYEFYSCLIKLNRKQCSSRPIQCVFSVFIERLGRLKPPRSSSSLTKAWRECAGWARRSVPPLLEGLAICPLAPAHQSGTGSGEKGDGSRGTLANRCGQIVD